MFSLSSAENPLHSYIHPFFPPIVQTYLAVHVLSEALNDCGALLVLSRCNSREHSACSSKLIRHGVQYDLPAQAKNRFSFPTLIPQDFCTPPPLLAVYKRTWWLISQLRNAKFFVPRGVFLFPPGCWPCGDPGWEFLKLQSKTCSRAMLMQSVVFFHSCESYFAPNNALNVSLFVVAFYCSGVTKKTTDVQNVSKNKQNKIVQTWQVHFPIVLFPANQNCVRLTHPLSQWNVSKKKIVFEWQVFSKIADKTTTKFCRRTAVTVQTSNFFFQSQLLFLRF